MRRRINRNDRRIMTTTNLPAWRQLTERVAKAEGVPLLFQECLDEYFDKRDGSAYDPVRQDRDAARLAVRRRLCVKTDAGRTVVDIPNMPADLSVSEYDHKYAGDAMRAYRMAVCRATLIQAGVFP